MFGHKQERGASRSRRAVAALCTVVMIAGLAGPAFAAQSAHEFESQLPSEHASSHPLTDLLLLRPLGMLALAGGVSLFIPAAAVTLMTRPHEIDKPFGFLIVAPAHYVWADGLGKH